MRTSNGRSRFARVTPLGLAFAALLLGVVLGILVLDPTPADAKEWDSPKDNVVLNIPDAPSPWEWLSYNDQWPKLGIIKGARRALTKLKRGGKPADGHGALMHLAVRKAAEGLTLQAAAEDADIRSFLLARFKGTEGEIESEEVTVESGSSKDGHPGIVLRTTGKANNLKAKTVDCTGYLLISIARGKLYLLRMYAFPTPDDDDCLVLDLDGLEYNGMRLINTKEDKQAEGPPKKGADGDGEKKGEDEKEEAREDEVLENRAQRWRITIDKKLLRQEITDEEKKDFFMELKLSDYDARGGYSLYVYAPPTIQYIDGVQGSPPNLIKWITSDWWQTFTVNHPKGDLSTYKWPRSPSTKGAKTFLTLPDMSDEKTKRVVIKDGKKRPIEVDAADMFKKLGFCEKVKGQIGKKGKVSEAVRGVMSGVRPRTPGEETIFRWAFRGRAHSYRVFVVLWGQGYMKWGDALRKTLESWEFGLKFKD